MNDTLESLREEIATLNKLWKETDNEQTAAIVKDRQCQQYKELIQARLTEIEAVLDNADLPRD